MVWFGCCGCGGVVFVGVLGGYCWVCGGVC